MAPNFKEEKKLWKQGFKRVAGLDEAGRGPLAGPVVAAAVILKSKFKSQKSKLFRFHRESSTKSGQFKIQNLRDSKKLSKNQREMFYDLITRDKNIKWGVGIVSEKVIDKINILEATKLAMEKAILKLKKKPDFLILDGNFKIYGKQSRTIPQKSIIKADEKVFSCAAASIIAKVTRDRIMGKYHKKYPRYCFDKHKGYPTELHKKMLKKYGLCPIHRKSFRPVSELKIKNLNLKTIS